MTADITPHCWTDRRHWIEETFGFGSPEWIAAHQDGFVDSTCMLLDGHNGPHEWVPDCDIGIELVEPTLEEPS